MKQLPITCTLLHYGQINELSGFTGSSCSPDVAHREGGGPSA